MTSRREGTKVNNEQPKTAESIMKNVEGISDTIKEMSDGLVKKYCSDLDSFMQATRDLITRNDDITDVQLEQAILELANILYFTGSSQEDLGIKEDTCKAIRQEIYLKARDSGKGTVADKTARAELATQSETLTLAIYSRTYKKVKLKVEAGYEMLNSLKKIMNRRISELELSNSRYIGKSNGISESN